MSNISCFNTWSEFLTSKLEQLSPSDEIDLKIAFDDAVQNFDKWLCLSTSEHQMVLANIEAEEDPVLLHSFLTVYGNVKEFGIGKFRTVALGGMGRDAMPVSLDITKLFTTSDVQSYHLADVFKINSKADFLAILAKPKSRQLNPIVKLPPCVILPPHIALAVLNVAGKADAIDLFLLAKEAIISNLHKKSPLLDGDSLGDVSIPGPAGTDVELKFTNETVLEKGGEILLWLLSHGDTALKYTTAVPALNGTLIRDATRQMTDFRLGRAAPQAAINEQTGDRASLAEGFEGMSEILQASPIKTTTEINW